MKKHGDRITKRVKDQWREKIEAPRLINKLKKHAIGEIDLKSTQVRAAEILLKKVIPDLKVTDMQVTDNTDYSKILAAARQRADR